jgi:hypothetical protein
MPGLILASVTSDSADGGAILTFAFPVALFVVVAVILYLRFSRPHRRVPARPILMTAHAPAPDAGTARAAAVAAGLPTAAGGGAAESAVEPAGATRDSAGDDGPGNVAGGEPAEVGGEPAEAGGADQEASTADGTEAGE